MRGVVVTVLLVALHHPALAKDALASRLKRPLGQHHLEAGEVWVEGVAATHVADYFDRGTADTFTTVTAEDGAVFMFTDLVAYTGEAVQFHATKEEVSLGGVPSGYVGPGGQGVGDGSWKHDVHAPNDLPTLLSPAPCCRRPWGRVMR